MSLTSHLPAATAAGAHPPLHIPAINGLRGIAILGVVYVHSVAAIYVQIVGGQWSAATVPVAISPLLTNGSTGVNLFFILSGFVLFLPIVAGNRPLDGIADYLSFYRHRSQRLLPLFYLAVTVEWVLAASLDGRADLHELLSVASLGFILDPRNFAPSFNPTLWSIGVEIAFSALFPLLVGVASRRGLGRLLTLVIGVALGARIMGILRYPVVHGISFNTDNILCHLDEFVLGMMLAQLYVQRRLPRSPWRWGLAGTVLVLVAWIGFDLTLRGILPLLTRAILNNVLDAGFFAIILAALVPETRLAAALSSRPLQMLGMMCYSIYIWHFPLLGWITTDGSPVPPDRFAATFLSFIFVTAAIAALSYRFVEFPQVRAWRPLFLLGPAPRTLQP